jgi:hypothetical protein
MTLAETLGLVFGTGLIAGFVDSIAGGGGLLTLPVLLGVLGDPASTIATLKTQSVMGTLAAAVSFERRGLIQPSHAIPALAMMFAAGGVGAVAVQHISPALLMSIIPLLLLGVAGYFLLSPRASDLDSYERLSRPVFMVLVAPVIGFYAGFFGPGTGAFLTLAFVALRGYGLLKANANTKMLECAASLGAVTLFLVGGRIVWPIAIAMGIGQMCGAHLGARVAIRHGSVLIRPMLVVVSLALTVKLTMDQPDGLLRLAFARSLDAWHMVAGL